MDVSGAALSHAYYEHVVGPAVTARWPGLPHAAGRLGAGSDVLGYDDAVSRDHARLGAAAHPPSPRRDGRGGRCPPQGGAARDRHRPPHQVHRHGRGRHWVEVRNVASFVIGRTGVAAAAGLSVADWLSLTGQGLLEVTAGPVFADTTGELTAVRDRLSWYPRDVWVDVVASDWARLTQELPFVGRTGERGDDLGSRVIAVRLAGAAMHLAHTLERRWTPYAEGAGTSAAALPRTGVVARLLGRALAAERWQEREAALVDALRELYRLQAQAGLPDAGDPVVPFWDRSYQGVRDEVVAALEASVTDPAVRALPRGVGSAEQRSDDVDVLVNRPGRRPPQ